MFGGSSGKNAIAVGRDAISSYVDAAGDRAMSNTSQEFELTQMDYERFRDIILERSGLYFPEEKRQILSRGLAEALQAFSSTSLSEYYDLLRRSPSTNREWDLLVSALTVGETYFFRNKSHFDALAQHILPEIIARQELLNRRIRIWSAGCATGEEPYSVAILLYELIPNIHNWNILILATDINRNALRKAQERVYGAWSFRGVEKRIQDHYFRTNGEKQYALKDEIKRMVTFEYLNLVENCYPSLANNTNGMDVIICRNVTIYFSPEVTRQVVTRFYNSLTDGGWLIPGASEPNMVSYQDFEPRNFSGAVVYRKPTAIEAKAIPAPVARASAPKPFPLASQQVNNAPLPSPDPYQVALELVQAGRMDEALVKLYEKLDQDPDFVPTYYTLGKVHANKGNLEEAQTWCARAIKKDKLHPQPYYTLSMVYQQNDLPDMALDALKTAIYLDREFILAHYNLAQLYRQQGMHRQAHKSLQNVQRLLESKPRNEPIPEGDGLLAGRLLELVKMELASKE